MAWTQPQYSREQVDRAGEQLLIEAPEMNVSVTSHVQDYRRWERHYRDALDVMSNWRSSHSLPLNSTKTTLLKRATSISLEAVVAQRLKRLPSIRSKLLRNPTMRLSRMHDIAGCRAVLPTVQDVQSLICKYTDTRRKKNSSPEFVKVYDYIKFPKSDGYRSVHLVFKYRGKSEAHRNLRVEVQVRSKLQHAWATAVETVSTFTGQALKSNKGTDEWKRFFGLMGTALAIREDCPVVPGTASNVSEMRDELTHLANRLNVETVLAGWGTALQRITEGEMRAKHLFLLRLDFKARLLRVRGFFQKEATRAAEEYKLAEEKDRDEPEVQVVLVSVDAVEALQAAYPNYFLDTTVFVEAMRAAISN